MKRNKMLTKSKESVKGVDEIQLKEELRDLIEAIGNTTGLTQEAIATSMNYGKTYISEMLSPTGRVTRKFIDRLLLHYDYLQRNPNNPNKDFYPEIKNHPLFFKTTDEWKVIRLLIHETAKVQAKISGASFMDCLGELNNKVNLVLGERKAPE